MIDTSTLHFPAPFLLAVSGGVDSMVLAHIALERTKRSHIFVAHFDHSLRGEASDGDRDFVQAWCQEHSVRFFVEKKDIARLAQEEKSSIEATAREYRYQFFADICEREHITTILTAHHLDDRIETAVFNLIRGTKFTGINALRESEVGIFGEHDKTLRIERPLLSVSKEDILQHALEHQIPFREDSTNADTLYQRNFLRQEILPRFAQINPAYRTAITNFMQHMQQSAQWQKAEALNWLIKQKNLHKNIAKKYGEIGWIFSKKDFSSLLPVMQTCIVEQLYRQSQQGSIGLSEGLMNELLRFIA